MQSYKRGKADGPVAAVRDCDPQLHGTKVHFLPDAEIFEETVYDYNTLKQRLRETAFLTKGLCITLKDTRKIVCIIINSIMPVESRNLWSI